MCYVYVLISKRDNKLYIGSTRQDLKLRLLRHNNGQVKSTKGRVPFDLLYSEFYENYTPARKREIYFKSGSGREHLHRILNRAGTQVAKGDRL
jgi:putative endonuclease